MKKKNPKESPVSSRRPELTADDSGSFSIDPKSMTPETQALLPLLKRSVEHMKKSNGYVKTTNQELIDMNKSQQTQNKLLKLLTIGMFLLWASLALGMWLAWKINHDLDHTNTELASVVKAMKSTKQAAEDTKKAVETEADKPRLTVKTDASGTPTALVVEQPTPKKTATPTPSPVPKKGGPPPPPAPPAAKSKKPPSVEFPLGPPRKKKGDPKK